MLVITRKSSESILIGDNIEVIISEINGDKVKLAIKAPKDVAIYRRELVETAQQNEAANISKDVVKAVDALKGLLK